MSRAPRASQQPFLMQAVGDSGFVTMGRERRNCSLWITHVDKLHLADQDRVGGDP
jgi:hypothetical protein